MPSYGSSDDASDDDIGVPKTPAVPTNQSEESDDSDSEDSDSSHSDDVANEEKRMHQNRFLPRLSSSDGSEPENKSSDNESESERNKPNRKYQANDDNAQDVKDNCGNENKLSLSSDNDFEKHSDDETKSPKKRKRSVLDSSDENSDQDLASKDKNPDASDLFGELSDEDEEKEEGEMKRMRFGAFGDNDETDENISRNDTVMRDIFGEDDDGEEREVEDERRQENEEPTTRIAVDIPRIVPNLGDEMHFVKLPNFLSVDTHPYDPQHYEDEIDDDGSLDEEGRARLKLKVENTIRWRNVTDEDGDVTRQSNARIVKWSDGSRSLHLGDEIFDIQVLNLLPGEHNHLFVRQGTGLQGQAVFKTKLIFRPFSTESFTHRKLTLSLADRSQKTQKICVLPSVGKDPEAHRSEMIKKEEVKLKASIRKESQQRRTKDRVYARGAFSSYLEGDDEDDESISIAKIKNQYKRGNAYTSQTYTDSDESDEDNDDSDLDIFDKKKSTEKKKIVVSDEDDD